MKTGLPLLLVEDNADDAFLFVRALSKAKRPHPCMSSPVVTRPLIISVAQANTVTAMPFLSPT